MTVLTIAALLQQSEYDSKYFNEWYARHQHDTSVIEPEKKTLKLKLLVLLLKILFFLPVLVRVQLILAVLSVGENLVRESLYAAARLKLWWLKRQGLKIVAIAGSYGKTSTKQIMEQLLAQQLRVLATPQSINTPLGIARVVLQQLQPQHQLFIVELGEYYPGDIQKLAQFIQPDFGVVTPVGRQHLERMADLQTIAATVGELAEYVGNSQQVLISIENREFFDNSRWNFYGQSHAASYYFQNGVVTRKGTEAKIVTPQHTFEMYTPLFGEHQISNILPAVWLAQQLGLDGEKIVKGSATLQAVSRRHEPMFLENRVLVLDNSYNTNPESVQASFKLFSQLEATHKIMLTLGFVELGPESQKIHTEFGRQLAQVVDYLGLIDSPQAIWIMNGFIAAGGREAAVTLGTTYEDILQQMQSVILPGSVIILEGGYKELYT